MRKQRTRAMAGTEEAEAEEGGAHCSSSAVPVVEQLDSSEEAEREEAIQTVEQLAVLSPELVPQLVFATRLADKLCSRMLDAKAHVREMAASLLKTLCQVGQDSVAEYFVSQDVLTPLLELFSK